MGCLVSSVLGLGIYVGSRQLAVNPDVHLYKPRREADITEQYSAAEGKVWATQGLHRAMKTLRDFAWNEGETISQLPVRKNELRSNH
eukprot:jgi/Chlat1/336/Chrsp1S03077